MNRIVLLCTLCLVSLASAQISYEPGFFTDANGTKINCLIRNLAWDDNPETFEYKLTADGETKRATLESALAFSVGGFEFRKFTVDIDKSETSVGNLTKERNPKFVKETLFLRLLFDGKVKLYQYKHVNLNRFFIDSNNGLPEQLVYKEYKIDDSHIGQNNQFRQQLFNALKSEVSSEKDFSNLRYTKTDLLRVLQKSAPETSVNQNISTTLKPKLNLKITAGAAFGKVDAKNWADDFFDKMNKQKVVPMIGFEAELVLPFNPNKWAIFVNPIFGAYSAEQNEKMPMEIKYNFIQIPVGARYYMFVSPKSKLFADAGIGVSIPISSSLTFDPDVNFPDTEVTIDESVFGAFAGIGFNMNRISLEARYDFPRRLASNDEFWHMKYSSVSLLASYRLN